jgi:hypothetical protein
MAQVIGPTVFCFEEKCEHERRCNGMGCRAVAPGGVVGIRHESGKDSTAGSR